MEKNANGKNNAKQLQDILEIDNDILSLEDIETIAHDKDIYKRYRKQYNNLHTMILKSLTHESFSEYKARILWEQILNHMENLNNELCRDVGIAVASLDYLSNIKSTLSDPKIIEEEKSHFIKEATTKDELTNLYMREVFELVIQKEFEQSKRKNTPLSLLMIDIDNFKKINDTYGHLQGDEVLKKVGTAIGDLVRDMDLAARYGGEEIAVLMPDTDINYAKKVAERIRHNIESLLFCNFRVTVSIGVSELSNNIFETTNTFIQNADDALYKAKENGKNRLEIYP